MSYIFLKAKTHDREVPNVVGTKCWIRKGGERKTFNFSSFINSDWLMQSHTCRYVSIYSPKTRMKSVLRDTTQNTCSYKTRESSRNTASNVHDIKIQNEKTQLAIMHINTYQKYQWTIQAEHLMGKIKVLHVSGFVINIAKPTIVLCAQWVFGDQ